MNTRRFLLPLIFFFGLQITAQIRDPSALLQLDSSSQGVLLPRMTTAQRDAIANPPRGLILYNTTTDKLNFYSGTSNSWVEIGASVSVSAVSSFTSRTNYQVVLTNNGLTDANITFATSDVTLNGVSGMTTAVDDTSQLLTPGDSHTVNYTLSLSGSIASGNTYGANYAFNSITTSNLFTMPAGELYHNGIYYKDVTSPTGEIWLDRNLGANQVATASNDSNAYGDLYQWGRNSDGHQSRTSGTAAGPVAAGNEGSNFITNTGDWLSTQDDTRWNGATKGTHDPCPDGYRVPTETEFNTERLQFNTQNSAGAIASVLKLPRPGLRQQDTAALGFVGSLAHYWTSTVNSTNARLLNFHANHAGMATNGRGRGLSIRCIKE